jgi:hypothetical protein
MVRGFPSPPTLRGLRDSCRAAAWQYIKTRVAIRVPRFVSLQLDTIEENVPWLKAIQAEVAATRFIGGPDRKVVPLIRDVVGEDKVDILYVLSPYDQSNMEVDLISSPYRVRK